VQGHESRWTQNRRARLGVLSEAKNTEPARECRAEQAKTVREAICLSARRASGTANGKCCPRSLSVAKSPWTAVSAGPAIFFCAREARSKKIRADRRSQASESASARNDKKNSLWNEVKQSIFFIV
jgi:hypothetical protein